MAWTHVSFTARVCMCMQFTNHKKVIDVLTDSYIQTEANSVKYLYKVKLSCQV